MPEKEDEEENRKKTTDITSIDMYDLCTLIKLVHTCTMI
jgi:hypothetical protein